MLAFFDKRSKEKFSGKEHFIGFTKLLVTLGSALLNRLAKLVILREFSRESDFRAILSQIHFLDHELRRVFSGINEKISDKQFRQIFRLRSRPKTI